VASVAPLFVELCAGLASLSLVLQGGRYARPPVSRMGNKHGYALPILHVMGLSAGQGAERFLWCEPDPGCRALLHAYTDREVMQEAARIIRSWKDEEPRALWERLRAEGEVKVGEPREVARWAFTVGNQSAYGTQYRARRWDDSGKPQNPPDRIARIMQAHHLPASVASDAVAVDPREVARWALLAQGCYRRGFPESGYDDEAARGRNHPAFVVQASMEAAAECAATVAPDARPITPADLPPGTVVFADPPYVGTTGYANDLPRAAVVDLAHRWHAAGARVYISEAEPLPELTAEGWHAVEITSQRRGQKRTFSKQQREWLTCSHPPAWTPPVQRALF